MPREIRPAKLEMPGLRSLECHGNRPGRHGSLRTLRRPDADSAEPHPRRCAPARELSDPPRRLDGPPGEPSHAIDSVFDANAPTRGHWPKGLPHRVSAAWASPGRTTTRRSTRPRPRPSSARPSTPASTTSTRRTPTGTGQRDARGPRARRFGPSRSDRRRDEGRARRRRGRGSTKYKYGATAGPSTSGRPATRRSGGSASTRSTSTTFTGSIREVPVEETWSAMAGLVAAGKVRWLGISEAKVAELERIRPCPPGHGRAVGALALDPRLSRRCGSLVRSERRVLRGVLASRAAGS